MSIDLVKLLLEARDEEAREEAGLRGQLAALHRRYPSNLKAASLPSPDLMEASHRVRINRAVSRLREQGIESQIRLSPKYDWRGRLHSFSAWVQEEEKILLLALLQDALYQQGMRALVTLEEKLVLMSAREPQEQEWVDWVCAGLSKPGRGARLWGEMSLEETGEWLNAVTEGEALIFHRAGLTPPQAKQWRALGSDMIYRFSAWRAAGLGPEYVERAGAIHPRFRYYEVLQPFLSAGLPLEWLEAWKELLSSHREFFQLSVHLALREEGFKSEHALALREAGEGLLRLTELRAHLRSVQPSERAELLAWLEIHPSLVELAAEHTRAGRSRAEIQAWARAHPKLVRPELVNQWEAEGWDAEEAAEWASQAGESSWARLWDPQVVAAWKREGEWAREPRRVRELAAAGLSPEQVSLALSLCRPDIVRA